MPKPTNRQQKREELEYPASRTGSLLIVATSLLIAIVFIGIGLSSVNLTSSHNQLIAEQKQTESYEKQLNSIKPQTSTIKASKLDLESTEKNLTSKYTKLVAYLYGGMNSASGFEDNQKVFENWFSPAGADAIKKDVIAQNGNKKVVLATKNNGVYVTFGKINYVDSTIPVLIYTTYETNSDGTATSQGQTIIKLTFDIKKQISWNATVTSTAIGSD